MGGFRGDRDSLGKGQFQFPSPTKLGDHWTRSTHKPRRLGSTDLTPPRRHFERSLPVDLSATAEQLRELAKAITVEAKHHTKLTRVVGLLRTEFSESRNNLMEDFADKIRILANALEDPHVEVRTLRGEGMLGKTRYKIATDESEHREEVIVTVATVLHPDSKRTYTLELELTNQPDMINPVGRIIPQGDGIACSITYLNPEEISKPLPLPHVNVLDATAQGITPRVVTNIAGFLLETSLRQGLPHLMDQPISSLDLSSLIRKPKNNPTNQ